MNQKTAFIFHGTGANPDMHWFPWLDEKLKQNGYEVIRPNFPTPENQSLENWLDVFNQYNDKLDSDSILIGHSTGAVFVLNVLEKYDQKIAGSFLVSGFIGPLGLEDFDPLNKTFAERDFNWQKIRDNSEKFFIYNSKDDPYVPFRKAKELEKKLNGTIRKFESGGHLNQNSGYTEFSDLLEDIKSVE